MPSKFELTFWNALSMAVDEVLKHIIFTLSAYLNGQIQRENFSKLSCFWSLNILWKLEFNIRVWMIFQKLNLRRLSFEIFQSAYNIGLHVRQFFYCRKFLCKYSLYKILLFCKYFIKYDKMTKLSCIVTLFHILTIDILKIF